MWMSEEDEYWYRQNQYSEENDQYEPDYLKIAEEEYDTDHAIDFIEDNNLWDELEQFLFDEEEERQDIENLAYDGKVDAGIERFVFYSQRRAEAFGKWRRDKGW